MHNFHGGSFCKEEISSIEDISELYAGAALTMDNKWFIYFTPEKLMSVNNRDEAKKIFMDVALFRAQTSSNNMRAYSSEMDKLVIEKFYK